MLLDSQRERAIIVGTGCCCDLATSEKLYNGAVDYLGGKLRETYCLVFRGTSAD